MEVQKKKKIAAIMGTIAILTEKETTEVIKDEEVLPCLEVPKLPVIEHGNISSWTIHGRSYSMNLRIMWQMKMYK